MLKYPVRSASVAVALCSLILMACGGGGSTDTGDAGGSDTPGSAAPTISPYVTYGTNPAEAGVARLSVVSVPLPGTTTQVLSSVPPFTHVVSQVKPTVAGQIPALEHAGIVHFDQPNEAANSGRWTRIDFTTGSNLQPIVISAETQLPCAPDGVFTSAGQAPQILLRKLTDARTAFIVYDLAGADGRCGTSDDVFKVLNYNGKATDAPVTLAGPVIGAIYDTAGNLSSVLQFADGRLLLTNDTTAFAAPTTLASELVDASTLKDVSALSINDIPFSLGFGRQLFVRTVDRSLVTTLHRLDIGGRYSAPLFTSNSQGILGDAASDGTHLYFVEASTESNGVTSVIRSSIQRVPLDGAAAVTELANFSGVSIFMIGLTDNYLLFNVFSPLSGSYQGTFPKAPTLLSGMTRVDGELNYYTRQRLCLNRADFAGRTAILANENGDALQAYENALWAGGRYTPDGSTAILPQISRTQALLAMGDGADGNGLANVQLYAVANDGTTTAFKAPDGSALRFNGYVGFHFSATAATDVGEMTDGNTYALDVFVLDFDRHVGVQLSNTPQNYEFPFY